MINKKELKSNKKEIVDLLKNIKREGIDNIVNWLDDTDFFTAPASTKFHGNYEGGLAKHSLFVYKELWKKVENYKVETSHDSIVIAGICHDFCKIGLYVPNYLKNKSLSESKPYKVEDNFPYGHGEKSVLLVQKHIELLDNEALMIRWHMGSYDAEWENYKGKLKKFPEVMLMQHADSEVSAIYDL